MRRFIAFVSLVCLGACSVAPPAAYLAACETQAGLEVFRQPAADGVTWALSDVGGRNATAFIIETGATWVEVAVRQRDVYPARDAPADAFFKEGPGLYLIRASFLNDPTCQSRLLDAGFHASTLPFTGGVEHSSSNRRWHLPGLDSVCAGAERIGDLPVAAQTSNAPSLWLTQASAPYVLVDQSEPIGPYQRHRRQIVQRGTGEVIAQDTSFSWQSPNYFDGGQSCGPRTENGPFRPFAARVFAPAD